jgi:signal transduction histidine kinase
MSVKSDDYLVELSQPSRLAVIDELRLLDSPADEAFDRLTRFAARLTESPVALVSIVTDKIQFFKSEFGLAEPWATQRQTPLSHSFCKHVVASGEPLVIENAHDEPLVRDNLGLSELNVVAYLGMPLVTSDGEVLGSFCVIDHQPHTWKPEDLEIMRELAQSVMTEIELRRELHLREHLEEEQKHLIRDLDAYGHLVAHELKNPIAAIVGFSDMLEQSESLSESDKELAYYIRCAGDQLGTIVESLLGFASTQYSEHLVLGQVNMKAVVEQAIDRQRHLMNLRHVEIEIVSDLPPITTHAVWIELVWINYISNAVKYGGKPPTLRIGADAFDDHVRYWIEDNGEGLLPEQQARVFDAFTRVNETEIEGHGLGLYLVRRIIEQLSGQVGVQSVPGSGSCFWFSLNR